MVGVDGLGGAGKSTLAQDIAAGLAADVVHTDDFSGWDRALDWGPVLINHVLAPLARGDDVRPFERARWTPEEPVEWVSIRPAQYLILEGVRAASRAFAPYLTYTIFIDAPADTRRARAVLRYDGTLPAGWDQWQLRQESYLRDERPDERADLLIVDLRPPPVRGHS